MSLPELLEAELDGESSVAQVQLGGEDVLVVTPSRTVVYRADGLLSDESIESYPHDAERIDLSVGRRKAKLTLDYGLDGDQTLSFPAKRVEKVLHPALAGIISAAGITDPGETVHKTFRFSDLTLIVTSQRVIKHIGSAVWDMDFEEFEYHGLTDVDVEEGSVATSIVLSHDGRQTRFKTPNSDARAVREAIVEAVCEFHDVTSIEELREAMADNEEAEAESVDRLDFGDGPDPLSAEPGELESTPENSTGAGPTPDDRLAAPFEDSDQHSTATTQATEQAQSVGQQSTGQQSTGQQSTGQQSTGQQSTGQQSTGQQSTGQQSTGQPQSARQQPADEQTVAESTPETEPQEPDPADAFEGSPFESAGPVDDDEISAQLAALTETVEQQQQQLARQAELIETLISELRRGR